MPVHVKRAIFWAFVVVVLVTQVFRPFFAIKRPVTFPHKFTPRIPQFNKSFIFDFYDFKQRIGMSTNESKHFFSFFPQRLKIIRPTHSGHISSLLCNLQLFNGLNLLVFFFLRDDFAGCSSKSDKAFFRTTSLYPFVASEYFGPAFFKKHDPYLAMMRFGINRIFIFTRKTVISCNYFPLPINEQLDCIKTRRVYTEQKPLLNQLRVNRYNGSNTAEEITVSY